MTAKAVRLGDVDVARIGLGTNRLAHTAENVAFVRDAIAAGISHIDTAYTYAGGDSETTIGEAIDRAGPTDGVVVATKGGYAPSDARPNVLAAQIDESLRRLQTEVIDLYYLHRVSREVPLEESVGALKTARDAGKLRHVGLSDVSVEQIERGGAVVPIVAVQNHYSLVERKYEEVVDHCARSGIVFVPYFPLRGELPPATRSIAERHGASPAQIALAWLLHRSPTMLPIPGSLSIAHVRDNLAAMEIELTDDEISALR